MSQSVLADKVTPGQIDGYALRAFKYEASAALALALHDETGWAIVAVADTRGILNGRARSSTVLHWAVCHPNGSVVDIEGARAAADVLAEFHIETVDGRAGYASASREQCHASFIEQKMNPLMLDVARTFVDPLLAQL